MRMDRTSLLASLRRVALVGTPLAVLFCVLVNANARAATRVYVDLPGIPRALPVGTTVIPLFVANGDAATTNGTVCVAGNGDELCGFSIGLAASGGITLDAFVPDTPATTISNLESGLLRVNAVAATSGRLGAIRIGSLLVTVVSAGQLQVVPGADSVGVSANLELRPIPATVVALPEPGLAAGVAAGASLVALALRSSTRP
jgi:hypothetical protein